MIGGRVKLRVEINQIDTRVGKFLSIREPFQIVAEVQPIHSGINSERFLHFGRNDKTSLGMTSVSVLATANCRSYI